MRPGPNAPSPAEPLAYSIGEACRVSSIGRTTLYKLIGDGTLEVRKIGKRTLVLASSLRELVLGEKAKPPWAED